MLNPVVWSDAEGESASTLTSAVAVSASTLAEDVRHLAQWCRSADEAREQQEQRLEQLERAPPLQSHLKALQDKACFISTCIYWAETGCRWEAK